MKRTILLSLATLTLVAACTDTSTRPDQVVAAPEGALRPQGPSKDDISNNLDASIDAIAEVMSLNVGGVSKKTTLYVDATNGDGKNGCNLTGSTVLGVSITSSNPAVATVSPSSATFTSCGFTQELTVTPVALGSATITVTQTSNNTGGTFNFGPATFTVNVVPPPNTSPTITISGVTGGATYDKGSVPTAKCNVTDAEDGNSSFDATLSAITGTYGPLGIGSQTASCSYKDAGGLTVSSSLTYSIVDRNTVTSIASSLNPSPYQAQVTFTATVKSVTPDALLGTTGTVTFKTGGASCSDVAAQVTAGPTNVVNGQATYQTSALPLGTTIVRACFDGTSAYTASEASVSQGVNTLTTTTSVLSSLNPSTYGTSVTFTATVTSGTPAAPIGAKGAIKFKTGGDNCSNATEASSGISLDASGAATYTTSTISAGTIVVRACYEGTAVYTGSEGTVSQVVNKADQTITFAALSPKTYGDAAFAISATGGGSGNAVTFSVDATSVGCSVSGTTVTLTGATPAGKSCVINANQAGNANYNAATQVQQSFEIAKAEITVTADAKSKYYGDSDPSPLTYRITSGALVGADKLTGSLTRATGENVAGSPYAITQGTLSGGSNYDLTFFGANFTIDPRPITVKAVNVSKTYDGDPYFGGYSIALVTGSILGNTDKLGDLGTPQFSTTPPSPVNAGTYPITVSGLTNGNYAYTYVNTGALRIDQRPITVTANPQSKYYGDQDPPLTYQLTAGNLVGTDALSGSLTRAAGETVTGGPYAITQGTLSAGPNYALTFVGANLTINYWKITGFYQPIDMDGVKNIVKGGLTVPLKFEIFAGTRELTATIAVSSFTAVQIACSPTGTSDDIELTTTGGTTLRYDATAGQFVQNWQTPKNTGNCYKATLTTQDGSSIFAFLQLK